MERVNPDVRSSYWDNVKFLLIILVVAGHFEEAVKGHNDMAKFVFDLIYTFHMPLLYSFPAFSPSQSSKAKGSRRSASYRF